MSTPYNLYNLEAPFKNYLLAGKVRAVSIKNYLSDFRHFCGFFLSVIPSEQSESRDPSTSTLTARDDMMTLITSDLINRYKSYLEQNNIPLKTINRRLSTIRKFCTFCISQGWMKENAAKKIGNVTIVGNRHACSLPNDTIEQFHHDNPDKTINLADIKEFFTIINS